MGVSSESTGINDPSPGCFLADRLLKGSGYSDPLAFKTIPYRHIAARHAIGSIIVKKNCMVA
jgi:hypothetical protein